MKQSTQVLIGANIAVLIVALALNWSIGNVLWTYWCESIIIGGFTALRISNHVPGLANKKRNLAAAKAIVLAVFFVIHYGVFHLVYIAFLKVLFDVTSPSSVLIAFLILAASHAFSFFVNKHKEKLSVEETMKEPYKRILPMHLTIIISGLVLQQVHFNAIMLCVFIALKTFIDAKSHESLHTKDAATRI